MAAGGPSAVVSGLLRILISPNLGEPAALFVAALLSGGLFA